MNNKSMLMTIVPVLVLGLLVSGIVALAAGNGPADGSCDNPMERDFDGDGILNCNDDDWTPPQDGTGYGAQGKKGQGLGEARYGNGDGICDGDGPHGNRGKGGGRGRNSV